MKQQIRLLILFLALTQISCQRTGGQTWEDVKTAGRYAKKSIVALWGNDVDSRLISSEEEFVGPEDEEFIPLNDQDLSRKHKVVEKTLPQSKAFSSNKVLQQSNFVRPNAQLAKIFRNLHFETDDHVSREKHDLIIIANIANFLKKNPNFYLMIEGHCDERASADYNLALGTRRANHIRVLLAKQGVSPDRILTVSYGKEKPVALGKSPEDLMLNRRAEFKIYSTQ